MSCSVELKKVCFFLPQGVLFYVLFTAGRIQANPPHGGE